jgi:hypothetical protein
MMSNVVINGSNLGTGLQSMLMCDQITPGASPSYALCKEIYLFHPLGAKMVEKPIEIAQSLPRRITVQDGPEDRVVEKFQMEAVKMKTDKIAFNVMVQARMYGIASVAAMTKGEPTNGPLDLFKIDGKEISIHVYDPLNTAGSLVLNQDPSAIDFQHANEIVVDGKQFHRSRARVIMNEFPIYISYTPSAFGFVGRSVYQRSLYPMKSYIQTMITNDMISVKAGVLVAKIQQAGSVITAGIQSMFGLKRDVVKEAVVGQVISIGTENEAIESIDLKNLSEPFATARKHIIEDIASGAKMPAKMLTEESFAEGFGEGSEDAKALARYVDGVRLEMQPIYEFLDEICMHRAWNKDFFEIIKKEFPERYAEMTYEAAFYEWKNSFKAEWPSLLTEPESEQVKVADVKLRALVALLEVMRADLDDENLGALYTFICDNVSEMTVMFGSPLVLDIQAMMTHRAEQRDKVQEQTEANPMRADSVIAALKDAVSSLDKPRLKAVK